MRHVRKWHLWCLCTADFEHKDESLQTWRIFSVLQQLNCFICIYTLSGTPWYAKRNGEFSLLQQPKGPFTIDVRADIFCGGVLRFSKNGRTLIASRNPLRNCERTFFRWGGVDVTRLTRWQIFFSRETLRNLSRARAHYGMLWKLFTTSRNLLSQRESRLPPKKANVVHLEFQNRWKREKRYRRALVCVQGRAHRMYLRFWKYGKTCRI